MQIYDASELGLRYKPLLTTWSSQRPQGGCDFVRSPPAKTRPRPGVAVRGSGRPTGESAHDRPAEWSAVHPSSSWQSNRRPAAGNSSTRRRRAGHLRRTDQTTPDTGWVPGRARELHDEPIPVLGPASRMRTAGGRHAGPLSALKPATVNPASISRLLARYPELAKLGRMAKRRRSRLQAPAEAPGRMLAGGGYLRTCCTHPTSQATNLAAPKRFQRSTRLVAWLAFRRHLGSSVGRCRPPGSAIGQQLGGALSRLRCFSMSSPPCMLALVSDVRPESAVLETIGLPRRHPVPSFPRAAAEPARFAATTFRLCVDLQGFVEA